MIVLINKNNKNYPIQQTQAQTHNNLNSHLHFYTQNNKILEMGKQFSSLTSSNSHSQTYSHTGPHSHYLSSWQTVDHMQNYNLVRNTQTGILGQSRKYQLDTLYSSDDQLKIYQLRRHANQPIVKAYDAQVLDMVSKKLGQQQYHTLVNNNNNNINNADSYNINNSNSNGFYVSKPGMCSKIQYMGVVTQRIQHLLYQLPALSLSQTVYTLLQCLYGYQYLYPKSGPFHITASMIGVNSQSKIKVWLNQNFSLNHPNHNLQIKSLQSTRTQNIQKQIGNREYNLIAPQYRDQTEMVQNLIDVIMHHMGHINNMNNMTHISNTGEEGTAFQEGLRDNLGNFRQVIVYVTQYIHKHRIAVPNNLKQAVNRLRTGPHNNMNNNILPVAYSNLNPNISNFYAHEANNSTVHKIPNQNVNININQNYIQNGLSRNPSSINFGNTHHQNSNYLSNNASSNGNISGNNYTNNYNQININGINKNRNSNSGYTGSSIPNYIINTNTNHNINHNITVPIGYNTNYNTGINTNIQPVRVRFQN